MGTDPEHSEGGLVQNAQPNTDVEVSGNTSDDSSWEKTEIVDATKLSPVSWLGGSFNSG